MKEIKIGGRRNGKSLENAITFMKYLDELENNKLYGIKKSGNITLLTKTECIPISVIEKKIEELEDIKIKTQRLYPHTYTAIGEWLEAHYKIKILQELLDERNNTDE